ncbi:MAG: hypothetical protein QOK40_2428 [Miltoncostaeaceae bacterium]|jgi:hypothetical protein|nr:hypothetical protein [Miltoncostaeaceae bacterium]
MLAFAAAVLAFVALPQARAATRKPTCQARAGTTIAANGRLRVFRATKKVQGRPRPVSVCAVGSRRVAKLGVWDECFDNDEIGSVTLAGRFLAYADTSCGLNSGDTSVRVFDAAAFKARFTGLAFTGPATAGSSRELAGLVITDTGAVAWIGTLNIGNGTGPAELHVRPFGGADTVIDRAPDHTLSDLALVGKRLYWMHGDQARTQTI